MAKALWPDRYRQWNVEIAMRYLPLVRQAKRAGYQDRITEIGSGDLGAAPYLRRRMVGVDTGFATSHPLLEQVEASVLYLPYGDQTRPYVLSTDMLEHIPPDLRQQAVNELVRVAGDYLVIAVPAGAAAEEQDRHLDAAYARRHGARYEFLIEHVDNGLPTRNELDEYLRTALAKYGRQADVGYSWNGNLAVRYWIMRCWVHGGVAAELLLRLLLLAHPLLSRANFGKCYRLVATVRFQ